jgi:hypothetical protein
MSASCSSVCVARENGTLCVFRHYLGEDGAMDPSSCTARVHAATGPRAGGAGPNSTSHKSRPDGLNRRYSYRSAMRQLRGRSQVYSKETMEQAPKHSLRRSPSSIPHDPLLGSAPINLAKLIFAQRRQSYFQIPSPRLNPQESSDSSLKLSSVPTASRHSFDVARLSNQKNLDANSVFETRDTCKQRRA